MPDPIATPGADQGTAISAAIVDNAVSAGAVTSDDDRLAAAQPADEGYRAEVQTPEAQAQETQQQSQETQQQQSQQVDDTEIQAGTPMPDSFRKAIASSQDPAFKAELQRVWDQHMAFRDVFPTIAEARAIRDIFPGGASDAKVAHQRALEFEQSDQKFLSGNPDSQRELASSMLDMGPQQFGSMLQVGAALLMEKHPDLGAKFADDMAVRVLAENHFPQFLVQLKQALDSKDANALNSRAQELLNWAVNSGFAGGKRQEAAPAVSPREKQLEAQLSAANQRISEGFRTQLKAEVQPKVEPEIFKLVEAAVKPLPTYAREAAKQNLVEQIQQGIVARLSQDQYYKDQLKAAKGKDAAVQIIVSRSLLHLKPVAKKVLEGWTPRQVENGNAATAQAAAAASRVDISGGGLTTGRPRAKLTQAEANNMTDEQLMEHALRR